MSKVKLSVEQSISSGVFIRIGDQRMQLTKESDCYGLARIMFDCADTIRTRNKLKLNQKKWRGR